jgi:hypothetical protein
MPLVVVNISSIFTGRVIQSLSTLELTVRRHFCSNLKHSPLPVLRRGEASNRSQGVRPLRAQVGLHQAPVNKAANIMITMRIALSTAEDEIVQCPKVRGCGPMRYALYSSDAER